MACTCPSKAGTTHPKMHSCKQRRKSPCVQATVLCVFGHFGEYHTATVLYFSPVLRGSSWRGTIR